MTVPVHEQAPNQWAWPVDDHGLTAKLEDGVLTVHVPKSATTKGQRVDVT